jgi:class 3 adenylate cyclase
VEAYRLTTVGDGVNIAARLEGIADREHILTERFDKPVAENAPVSLWQSTFPRLRSPTPTL